MGLRLLSCLALLAGIIPCEAYLPPNWSGLVWRFNLAVSRNYNFGVHHGYDHFIATAQTIHNGSADGVTVFGNGYGSSVWDISLTLKVDGGVQVERRFAAPGDGNWHWSNHQKQPQQGLWRNAANQSEYRYYGYHTNDTLINLFLDGGWSYATGGEPNDYRNGKSAFLWVPGLAYPLSNLNYADLQRHGWAGQISYGLDPRNRSRWGVPKRAEFWVKAWMHYPQFLEFWWYEPYYWNRDYHAQYFGGNPYEGISVYFNRRSGELPEISVPSGQLQIIKGTQHKGFQVGIQASGMAMHDKWMVFRRDFSNGNPNASDAAQIGYRRNTSQAFFADKKLGTKIAEGTTESASGWRAAEFTATKGGLTRYYLVMRGNSDWGWHRVADVVDVRPYEINTDYWITSPDATCSWTVRNGVNVPVWRTRIDKGFSFHLSVIDASVNGPDVGDQHVAVRAVQSGQFGFAWSSAYWLGSGKQILRSGTYQASSWESAPNPPLSTGFRKGLHALSFSPADLSGKVGTKGRIALNAWRQHIRTTHSSNLNLSTGAVLGHSTFTSNGGEIYIDVHPFATALATLIQPGGDHRIDTLESGAQINLGTLAGPPLSATLSFANPYPVGGLYLFLTTPGNESVCLAHNFNNTSGAIGSAAIGEHVNEPGDYYLRVVEFNPFDSANLGDFVPNASLPTGSGQAAAGYFAPYGMNMGWRRIGEYRFSIPNNVHIRGMLIGGGLTR